VLGAILGRLSINPPELAHDEDYLDVLETAEGLFAEDVWEESLLATF